MPSVDIAYPLLTALAVILVVVLVVFLILTLRSEFPLRR